MLLLIWDLASTYSVLLLLSIVCTAGPFSLCTVAPLRSAFHLLYTYASFSLLFLLLNREEQRITEYRELKGVAVKGSWEEQQYRDTT